MSLTVEKCLQGWTNSLRQMNAKADIIFFGDSLTYYGDFSSSFPGKVVCNLGLRGDTIQGMIERIEQVKLLEPRVVYLMAGINDVATCTSRQFEEKYDLLTRKILEFSKKDGLVIQSILPVNDTDYHISCNNEQINDCNRIIAQIANHYHLQHIDLYPIYLIDGVLPKDCTIDGIHLRKSEYNKWYNELLKNRNI